MLQVETQTFDITIDSGCQEKIKFTLLNSDGTPYNGAGALVTFVVKESLDDALSAAKIKIDSTSNPSQFDVTQIAVGIVTIELLASNLSGLGGKKYHYGLRVVGTDAKPHTPRVGLFTVRKDPTI